MDIKPAISYEDFSKIDVRIGTIVAAEIPEGSEKLVKLSVDFGEDLGKKTIFAGIKAWYSAADLLGVQTTFVVNMEPRKMGTLGYSEGMLFAASPVAQNGEESAMILVPEKPVVTGTRLR